MKMEHLIYEHICHNAKFQHTTNLNSHSLNLSSFAYLLLQMFPRSSSQNSNWLTDSLSIRSKSAETDKSVGHRFYGLVKDECHRDYSISNSRTESLAQDRLQNETIQHRAFVGELVRKKER